MTPHAVIAPARLAGNCLLRSQSDERLVDLVRAGNERAFEAIVQRYRGPLLRHCRRMLPEGRAEDALQQTLLRAHSAMHADDRPLHLRPWLFRIATNASLDALRQPGWAHEPLDPNIDGVERPDQAFERREDLRAALAAVERLPARQRDVIVLRELEGRSYEEIAHELGVSGGAVRQLLHRGRVGLRGAATAVTPGWLITRISFVPGDEPLAARVAELAAGPGSVGLAQGVATVLAIGTIAGGVAATGPLSGSDEGLRSVGSALEQGAAASSEGTSSADPVGVASGEGEGGSGHEGEDRSGPNPGSDGDGEDRSGRGDGDEIEDRSGPSEEEDLGELRERTRRGKTVAEADEPDDAPGRNRGRGRAGDEPTEEAATADPISGSGKSDPDATDLSGSGSSGTGSTSGSSGTGSGADDPLNPMED